MGEDSQSASPDFLSCNICDCIVSFAYLESIVLTGARPTGKTSAFFRLFPSHSFVSLDLPTEAEQAEKEPHNFLQRHPHPSSSTRCNMPRAIQTSCAYEYARQEPLPLGRHIEIILLTGDINKGLGWG
jgi:hypothetical protein